MIGLEAEEKDLEFNGAEIYSSITYELTLDRLSLFYVIYIILPIIALSALFLLVFFIPVDSGERMGFGVSILLSLTVYLLVIFEIVPANSNTRSMLGGCFTTVFYLLSAGVCAALLNIILASKERKPHYYLLELMSIKIRCKRIHREEEESMPLSPRKSVKINPKTFYCEDKIENLGQNNIKNVEQDEVGKASYNEEWKKISKKIDKTFAVVLAVLLILLPLFLSAGLPRDRLRG